MFNVAQNKGKTDHIKSSESSNTFKIDKTMRIETFHLILRLNFLKYLRSTNNQLVVVIQHKRKMAQ